MPKSRMATARMCVEMEQSRQRTFIKAAKQRPKNTERAYSRSQKEFRAWCNDKGDSFDDETRYTVTGEKVHLFLEERVIGRAKHVKAKRNQTAGQVERVETIGASSVNSYIAGLVDMWKLQCRLGVNSHPTPRDEAVTALLKVTEHEEDERKRKNFEDRGADTMLDGYSTFEQLKQISSYFWSKSRSPASSLRNLLAFQLSHYSLLRGESARDMELADMHCVLLENEGYSECKAVVLVMRHGKMNQVGRIEVGASMRSKYVEICPHGLLGFYLFYRWQVQLEPFPNFTTSEQWYPIKLMRSSKDNTTAMNYSVHRIATMQALEAVGIKSKAKTHIGRGSGARMADLAGASEAQIRRMGRWNNQAMEKCYLTSLPREFMRTLAGFEPCRGSFFLARSSVEPPISLMRQVFPQVEMWKQALDAKRCEQTIAAGGFLELLLYLRKVILQDAIFMQDLFPNHPMWQHPVFQSTEFLAFKNEARERVVQTEDPADHRLQKAMPDVKAKLDGLHEDLKASLDKVSTKVDKVAGKVDAMQSDMAQLGAMMRPLFGGTALFRMQVVNPDDQTSTAEFAIASTADESTEPAYAVVSSGSEDLHARTFKLSRGIERVSQLWKEWYEGVDGRPAVQSLEDEFGTRWCSSDERRFFNRRRKVIDLARRIVELVKSARICEESDAVAVTLATMDAFQADRRVSLNWMSNNAGSLFEPITTLLP